MEKIYGVIKENTDDRGENFETHGKLLRLPPNHATFVPNNFPSNACASYMHVDQSRKERVNLEIS